MLEHFAQGYIMLVHKAQDFKALKARGLRLYIVSKRLDFWCQHRVGLFVASMNTGLYMPAILPDFCVSINAGLYVRCKPKFATAI